MVLQDPIRNLSEPRVPTSFMSREVNRTLYFLLLGHQSDHMSGDYTVSVWKVKPRRSGSKRQS